MKKIFIVVGFQFVISLKIQARGAFLNIPEYHWYESTGGNDIAEATSLVEKCKTQVEKTKEMVIKLGGCHQKIF